MQAGRLRHKIAIQATTPTRNEYGEPIDSWATISGGSVWASIEPLSGKEDLPARVMDAEVSHRITIRALSSVTTNHRILLGSRVFDINAVLNWQDRGIFMVLMCTEDV